MAAGSRAFKNIPVASVEEDKLNLSNAVSNAIFRARESSEFDTRGTLMAAAMGFFISCCGANDLPLAVRTIELENQKFAIGGQRLIRLASQNDSPRGGKPPADYSKSVGQCSCSSRSIDRRGFWRPESPSHSGRILKRRRLSFPGYEDLAWLISCSE